MIMLGTILHRVVIHVGYVYSAYMFFRGVHFADIHQSIIYLSTSIHMKLTGLFSQLSVKLKRLARKH